MILTMPRVARNSVGGMICHVLNRSNSRRRLFATDADYHAFLAVLAVKTDSVRLCLDPAMFGARSVAPAAVSE